MTDADAFLEAIRANPQDDLPRLVYADWLEEHGEGLYAQLIRLGDVIKKRVAMPPAERKAMRLERYHLFKRLEASWGQLPPGTTIHSVVNSYTGEPSTSPLRFTARSLLEWDGSWPVFLPRRRVTITDYFGLERLVIESPRLHSVTCLGFMGHPGPMAHAPPHAAVSDPLIRALIGHNLWPDLRELGISDLCPSKRMLEAFAQSSSVSRLMRLHYDWPIDPNIGHRWIDVQANQPPDGAIAKAIRGFIDEYGEMLPAE